MNEKLVINPMNLINVDVELKEKKYSLICSFGDSIFSDNGFKMFVFFFIIIIIIIIIIITTIFFFFLN